MGSYLGAEFGVFNQAFLRKRPERPSRILRARVRLCTWLVPQMIVLSRCAHVTRRV